MIHTHFMPPNPPATPKKYFQYNLPRIRLPALPRHPAAPLPEWVCPVVIAHDARLRRVVKLDIRAPLAQFDPEEMILNFGATSLS